MGQKETKGNAMLFLFLRKFIPWYVKELKLWIINS